MFGGNLPSPPPPPVDRSLVMLLHGQPFYYKNSTKVLCRALLSAPEILCTNCTPVGELNHCHNYCDIIPNLQFFQDWHLALIVLIFVIVDLIILITVTAIDGVRYTVRTLLDPETPAIVDVSSILHS